LPADQKQVLGKAAANRKTKKEQENTEGRTSIPKSSRSNTTNRTSSSSLSVFAFIFFTYNICRTGKKKEQKVTDVEESKNRKTDANTGQEEKI
jgi:hypothetical protein